MEKFSRVGTGHVNLPSGHGAEESVGGATSPQALDQRGGRLTSPLKTRWTRVDGWVTHILFLQADSLTNHVLLSLLLLDF